MLNHLMIACRECDLLIQHPQTQLGEKACCPRCGCVLYSPRKHTVERTFALSIAGLLFYFPAMFLPMLGIQLLGDFVEVPLWRSFTALFDSGLWLVAVLVLLSSVIFPFLKLFMTLAVSANLYFNNAPSYVMDMMRWIHHMDEWAMLEVYTLGIIVAIVKLSGDAQVFFDWGLYSFAMLMLITTLLSSTMDEETFWEQIGMIRSGQTA